MSRPAYPFLAFFQSSYKSYFKIQVTTSTSRKDIEGIEHVFGEKLKGERECFWIRKDFVKKGLSQGLFQIWKRRIRTSHQKVQNII
jgi:hypothetical protein